MPDEAPHATIDARLRALDAIDAILAGDHDWDTNTLDKVANVLLALEGEAHACQWPETFDRECGRWTTSTNAFCPRHQIRLGELARQAGFRLAPLPFS